MDNATCPHFFKTDFFKIMPSLKDADSLATKMQEHLSNRFPKESFPESSRSSDYFSLQTLLGDKTTRLLIIRLLTIGHCLNFFLQVIVSGAGWIQQEKWCKKWGIKSFKNNPLFYFWILLIQALLRVCHASSLRFSLSLSKLPLHK